MADHIYLRHFNDKQIDARQRHALASLLTVSTPHYEYRATFRRQPDF